MPKDSRSWKIATGSCKKSGFHSFKKGSAGDHCRKKRAEGIARRKKR